MDPVRLALISILLLLKPNVRGLYVNLDRKLIIMEIVPHVYIISLYQIMVKNVFSVQRIKWPLSITWNAKRQFVP